MKLHLLIPSLFWPEDSLPEIYRDLPLPALETLLAKSLRTEDGSNGLEAWLCHTFGVEKQQDWPVAPITLQADSGGQVTAGNHWERHCQICATQSVWLVAHRLGWSLVAFWHLCRASFC